MHPEGAIVLTQPVGAERSAIWRAIAEPEGLARWQADVVEGSALLGGTLRLAWPALGSALELEVVERDEHERIALRAGEWLVRLEIRPGEVTLTHEGLARDHDLREGTRSGWCLSLALLAHALVAHPHGARSVAWATATASVTAAQAHAFFTDPAALGAWLGTGSGVSRPGSLVELQLAWGERLTGKVLANEEGRDVAFSWAERGESVLALRTMPLGSGARLVAVSWSRWRDLEARTSAAPGLAAAVGRLAHLLSVRHES